MSRSSTRAAMNRRRKNGLGWLTGVLATVVAGVLVFVFISVISNISAANTPPVNVKVVNNSVCNFVAPLSGALIKDPTKLDIRPAEINSSCDKALAKVRGVRTEVSLEVVLAPSGDAAIVLTDVTIHVLKSSPVDKSAFYTPAGRGGGGQTLSIEADVENKTAVGKVDVYAEDGTMKMYSSVLAVRPRPTATKVDPLIVDIGLHGHKNYTNFDVDLHWQSSTASGVFRLENGGAGYMVGGSDGLASFNGFDGDRWVAGTN